MPKKLSDITDIPQPSPEEIEKAKAEGAEIRAYDPNRLEAFIQGRITLGELEGIPKDAQYDMAKLGFGFLGEGKLDKARSVFEGLLALDPYDAYFQTAVGSIAHQEGKLEEAEARYSRALEINPFSAVARAHRGEIRLANGQLTEAIDDFVRAIQEDPEANEPATRRARALLMTVQSALEAAEADPETAIKDSEAELVKVGAEPPMPPSPEMAKPPDRKPSELEPPPPPEKKVQATRGPPPRSRTTGRAKRPRTGKRPARPRGRKK